MTFYRRFLFCRLTAAVCCCSAVWRQLQLQEVQHCCSSALLIPDQANAIWKSLRYGLSSRDTAGRRRGGLAGRRDGGTLRKAWGMPTCKAQQTVSIPVFSGK